MGDASIKMQVFFIFFLDPTSALDDGYLRAVNSLEGILFMKQLNDRWSAVGFLYTGNTFTSPPMLDQQHRCSVVNVTKGVWPLHLRS